MNSGIAKQIRAKWPQVYDGYLAWFDAFKDMPGAIMGSVNFVDVAEGLTVANCFGQYYYGTEYRQTDYPSLFCCLDIVCREANRDGVAIHLPKIGCGLAGGDWAIVEQLLKIAHDTNNCPLVTVWEL